MNIHNPFEHFEIIRELGRGGMGVVYEVKDKRRHDNDARFALKVMSHSHEVSVDDVLRFRQEASALAQVDSHPNVLRIHQFIDKAQQSAFVMELVAGNELAECLHQGKFSEIPEELKLAWLRAICLAIDHLHDQGIIHRDLKAANIMIRSADSSPVLMDFGLAKMLSGESLTLTGEILGTPYAMSPQQIKGDEASPKDDIWALGVLAYELFTGERPFVAGSLPKLLAKIQSDEADLDRLPAQFQHAVKSALAKDPKDRLSSGADFFELLTARPETSRYARFSRVSLFVCLAVLVVGLSYFGFQSWKREQQATLERQFQVSRLEQITSAPAIACFNDLSLAAALKVELSSASLRFQKDLAKLNGSDSPQFALIGKSDLLTLITPLFMSNPPEFKKQLSVLAPQKIRKQLGGWAKALKQDSPQFRQNLRALAQFLDVLTALKNDNVSEPSHSSPWGREALTLRHYLQVIQSDASVSEIVNETEKLRAIQIKQRPSVQSALNQLIETQLIERACRSLANRTPVLQCEKSFNLIVEDSTQWLSSARKAQINIALQKTIDELNDDNARIRFYRKLNVVCQNKSFSDLKVPHSAPSIHAQILKQNRALSYSMQKVHSFWATAESTELSRSEIFAQDSFGEASKILVFTKSNPEQDFLSLFRLIEAGFYLHRGKTLEETLSQYDQKNAFLASRKNEFPARFISLVEYCNFSANENFNDNSMQFLSESDLLREQLNRRQFFDLEKFVNAKAVHALGRVFARLGSKPNLTDEAILELSKGAMTSVEALRKRLAEQSQSLEPSLNIPKHQICEIQGDNFRALDNWDKALEYYELGWHNLEEIRLHKIARPISRKKLVVVHRQIHFIEDCLKVYETTRSLPLLESLYKKCLSIHRQLHDLRIKDYKSLRHIFRLFLVKTQQSEDYVKLIEEFKGRISKNRNRLRFDGADQFVNELDGDLKKYKKK